MVQNSKPLLLLVLVACLAVGPYSVLMSQGTAPLQLSTPQEECRVAAVQPPVPQIENWSATLYARYSYDDAVSVMWEGRPLNESSPYLPLLNWTLNGTISGILNTGSVGNATIDVYPNDTYNETEVIEFLNYTMEHYIQCSSWPSLSIYNFADYENQMHWSFNDTIVDNATEAAFIASTTSLLNNTFRLVENASAYLIDGFDPEGIAENLSEFQFLMQWNTSHHLLRFSYLIENATIQEDENVFVFSLGRALGRTTPLILTGVGNVTVEGPFDQMILEATPDTWFPGITSPDYRLVWTFVITSDVPVDFDITIRFQQAGGMMLAAFGSAIAIALASLGAALGIGYSGNAMIGTVRRKPEAFSKGMISVVLAEALSIYGLLCAFMVIMRMDPLMPVSEGVLSIAAGIAIGLAGIGAGIGIASAGSALCWSLQYRPEAFSKALVSVVLAEALSIYGLLVSFIVIMRIGTAVTMIQVFVAVTAALTVGLGGFFAGLAIGWGGSAMTGSVERRPESFSKSMVAVVLAEALAIYTLLVAFMLLMA